MSEIQTPSPEQEQFMVQNRPEQQNQAESINFKEIQIALLGLKARFHEWRRDRAGDTMENMDHKNALYSDYGHAYTTGSRVELGERTITETASSDDWIFPDGKNRPDSAEAQGATGRSVFERYKISRLEKKRNKLKLTRDKRKFHEKAFHIYETQNPSFRDDSRPVLEVMDSSPIGVNSLTSRFESKSRQAGIDVGYYKGNSTPEERRRAKNLAKINRPTKETKGQRKHRKREERAIKGLVRTAEQPVLTRWRNIRRNRSIDRIKSQHSKAEESRQKIETLRNNNG